jgi:hypothetical protein
MPLPAISIFRAMVDRVERVFSTRVCASWVWVATSDNVPLGDFHGLVREV